MQTSTVTNETSGLNVKPDTLARLFNPGPDFCLVGIQHEQRLAVEEYIAAKFYKDHQAQISSFMPCLLTMTCAGNFSSSVGIRPAAGNRLFIETYLDHPIENYVSNITQRCEQRDSIVEIGNLVATLTGASQLLFIMLTAVLYHARYRWVAFTATAQVENLLKKLNFTCHTLCAADPERLGDNKAQWGKYYDTRPHVIVIDVVDAMQKAHQNRLANSALSIFRYNIKEMAEMLPDNTAS